MKIKFAFLLVLLVSAVLCQAGTKIDGVVPCDAKIIGRKVVDNLLERKYMMYDNRKGLHYAESCSAVGAPVVCRVTNDKELGATNCFPIRNVLDLTAY